MSIFDVGIQKWILHTHNKTCAGYLNTFVYIASINLSRSNLIASKSQKWQKWIKIAVTKNWMKAERTIPAVFVMEKTNKKRPNVLVTKTGFTSIILYSWILLCVPFSLFKFSIFSTYRIGTYYKESQWFVKIF